MPVTTLDPQTGLILIDLQKGIVARDTKPYPAADVVEKSAALAAAFRQHRLPVILVHVTGGAPGRNEQPPQPAPPADWADLVPELDRQPGDHVITKQTWGAFVNTGLEEKLRSLGVTQVVIAGIATAIGVESTARQAYEAGFNVTLAIDAMTDLAAETHHNSVERIFPRVGETGTADAIIALLAQR
ncbi:isochorismatase family protein [Sphingomonas sp.]|uniref:isochorismatase family protein n=1 Tax=Sphingomonas sp. TaxID=28214 RepID=UPI003B3AD2AB